ncbi:hypothetical protein cyc_07235 [Cyclospora cayetanensis]|uniref:Uncharacterized protein n=1 Tax=Cyclospora cayetanensis TaxID=88456 RepID=A0A1D3D0B4_9EIME|nr:hypothetical protein cyc_07235 [Cyclospora cayetanensis]
MPRHQQLRQPLPRQLVSGSLQQLRRLLPPPLGVMETTGTTLEHLARAAFCCYEDKLHLVPFADVGRCAWLAAAVLPGGVSSNFFPLAVNARMHAGLLREQNQQQDPLQGQQNGLSLNVIADALHPFSHEALRQSMSFLRDPLLIHHISSKVAAAPDAPRDTLLKLLHVYTGIPDRLGGCFDELPDALVADLCSAAGGLPPMSAAATAVKANLLSRANQLHPQALAEAAVALADHMSAEELLKLSALLLPATEALQQQQQLALLLLYNDRCVAALPLLHALEELHAVLCAALRSKSISINGAVECLLSLSIAGWTCTEALSHLNWPEALMLCSPRAVSTLAWVAAAQRFRDPTAWTALAAALYTAPFVIKPLNLVFEPLKASPIHLGSGLQMGEVALRHGVWSALGYNTLSLMDSEFERFCLHAPEVYVHPRDPLQQQQRRAARQYDIPAAAAHLQQKINACKPRLRELQQQQRPRSTSGRHRLVLLQHQREDHQEQQKKTASVVRVPEGPLRESPQ